jgi:HIP---CoA ligase
MSTTAKTASWRSIPEMLAASGDSYGDLPAIDDGDVTLTYSELIAASRTFSAALVDSGIEPGDRVSIWMPNGIPWVISVLGLFQAGAVLVPINTRFKGAEAAVILSRSRAKALVTVTDFLGADYLAMLTAAGVDLPDLTTTIVARGTVAAGAQSWDAFLARANPQNRAIAEERRLAVGPEDPSDILFTSGTTGTPKGVVMTHSRTLAVATDWVAMAGLRTGDRYLQINPYFHMFGLKAGILASVASGATMLPEPVFDVDRVLSRVESERVTVLPGAPTIYQAILDHPQREKFDLSTLRVAVTGAAEIPVVLIERMQTELPFSLIVSGYGLTEGGTSSGTEPDDEPAAIATTVGRPRPGFAIRIVDGSDHEVAAGDPGEILLQGPSVMSHYLDDPDATKAALSDDGWLRTGDIGVVDPAGRLRIVGRAKDMFIVGGFNAYPAEIENALMRHTDIVSAAVIGIPDERMGEVGMAFVVLAPGSAVTAAQIIAWSRDEMANYKVPRAVEIVDALPLNATGKVMKDELRARAARD